jgi:hypothetical protein
VLAVVTVQKTILSTADSATALKFFDNATQSFEAEVGLTINEPGTYAVKAATEMAVVELIKEGARKGVWEYQTDAPAVVYAPTVAPKEPVISSEIKKEVKVEEKKDVVVQSQTQSKTKTGAAASAAPEVKIEKKEETKITVQDTARPLFGERKLKEGSYLYASENEASTKKWWFPKGSVVSVRQPGSEGWWRVNIADGTDRGGWIRTDKLE